MPAGLVTAIDPAACWRCSSDFHCRWTWSIWIHFLQRPGKHEDTLCYAMLLQNDFMPAVQNIMDTEAKASILFGAIVSVTGIGGNLIGGWLTDKRFKKEAAKAGMTDVKQLLEGGGDSAASVEDEESAAFPGNAEGTEVTLQQPDVKAGPVAGVDENGLELVDLSTPKGLGRSFSQGSSKVPYQRYSPAETPAAQQEASPDAGPGAQAISRQSQKARDIALSTSLPVMAFVGMLGYACVLAVPWSADGGRYGAQVLC